MEPETLIWLLKHCLECHHLDLDVKTRRRIEEFIKKLEEEIELRRI